MVADSGAVSTALPQDPVNVAVGLKAFVAVLGCAGSRLRLPDLPPAWGVEVSGEHLSDQEVLLAGSTLLPQQLQHNAAGHQLRYLVLAPSARSYLKAKRRRGHDEVERGFDLSVMTAMRLTRPLLFVTFA